MWRDWGYGWYIKAEGRLHFADGEGTLIISIIRETSCNLNINIEDLVRK